jgi:hypothetical protein
MRTSSIPTIPSRSGRSRTQPPEYFRAVHPAADRDRSADGWVVGRRSGLLSAIAGGGAAAMQLLRQGNPGLTTDETVNAMEHGS